MEKILEQFPEYTGKGEFVGTRQYWEGIFGHETNRDPELHAAFGELHERLVNEVIRFCKEHGLDDVDAFGLGADGLKSSITFGEWCPATDSSMTIYKCGEKKPFLYEI